VDAAVGLVEAYLYANGFFTVTEYPVIEAQRGGGFRAVTDLDILGIRLPGAGRIVSRERGRTAAEKRLIEPDRLLLDPEVDKWTDFIIGEVKEGKAELQRGARERGTLIAALRRFVFVEPDVAERLAESLLREGRASLPDEGVQVRLFAFGSRRGDRGAGRHQVILLRQCIEYLVRIGREFSAITAASQIKNPTVNLLTVLAKSGVLDRSSRSGRKRGNRP
jgi:hypothetical protein